jgi:hypothetical protein
MSMRKMRLLQALALCLASGACAAGPPSGRDREPGIRGGDGVFIHIRGDDYPGPALTGGYSGG